MMQRKSGKWDEKYKKWDRQTVLRMSQQNDWQMVRQGDQQNCNLMIYEKGDGM